MRIHLTQLSAATVAIILMSAAHAGAPGAADTPNRQAYFGDLHIHTAWSLDTYQIGLLSTPEDAYRYARGEAITHVNGEQIKLASGPLDFLAVADHAEYMAMARTFVIDKDSPLYKADYVRGLESADKQIAGNSRQRIHDSLDNDEPIPELVTPEMRSYPWEQTIAIANRFNEPHKFTTFVGFEWTAMPDRANLHRVVLFANDQGLPEYPLSAFDTSDPVELWRWMDKLRANGAEVLAIPHNANISNGRMFPMQLDSNALTQEYAELRRRNEPLVEIMQVKGASETHPLLSRNDEWADFALNQILLGKGPFKLGRHNGSYTRQALTNGLTLQQELGINPYEFGLIGSSDTHSTTGTYEEDNYVGSHGANDATPELRLKLTNKTPPYADVGRPVRFTLERQMSRNGAGLAGVWAEENTRASIFAAFARKETFGTSGPRIRVRLFAGWGFAVSDAADEMALANAGYSEGVPMGGRLAMQPDNMNPAEGPTLLLQAIMDPNSAPLQRLQVVKGWLENGEPKEAVYDALCAGNTKPDPRTQRCPANNATVSLKDCSYSRTAGSATLLGTWRDRNFDASQSAFYYVRVLENPTCRWSTWDAVRLGVPIPEFETPTIQERAWTSPIWYVPE